MLWSELPHHRFKKWLVEMIKKKYSDTGGRIHYNSKVTKIIVKNGAADSHYAIFEML